MKTEEIKIVLDLHKKWIGAKEDGERANLRRANLQCADLQCADLWGANLQCADLQCADLRRANLQCADLRCADLLYANLQGADLRHADLQGTNLRRADLQGADLQGANLDFSCWPLWCGSLDVTLDAKQKRQLLYHILAVAPEYRTPELIEEANKFHRMPECHLLTMPERTKE